MRRVKYYERQFPNETRTDVFYDGERVLVGEATFHDWSLYAGHAAAIIELDDGNCKYVTADMIQFIDGEDDPKREGDDFLVPGMAIAFSQSFSGMLNETGRKIYFERRVNTIVLKM